MSESSVLQTEEEGGVGLLALLGAPSVAFVAAGAVVSGNGLRGEGV